MSDEELYQRFLPKLTEVTELSSANFYHDTGGVVSANGKRSALDAFTLVLATDEQEFGPFLLNAVAAQGLCRLLVEHGFGPPIEQRQA